MGEIISFISVKGGVGKTRLAVETASILANDFKKRVLLVDTNFSAPNIGLYFGLNKSSTLHDVLSKKENLHAIITEAYNIDIVPSSMYFNDPIDKSKLKKILEKYSSRYDFIILDSSPSPDEMLSSIIAADRLFVVTTSDNVTLQTSLKSVRLGKEKGLRIDGIIINRIKGSSYELGLREVEREIGLPVLAKIKENDRILEATHFNVPLSLREPSNEVSKEIKKFVLSLLGEKEKESFFSKILKKHFRPEQVNREMYRQRFSESLI